jgi:hypothetical protein
VDRRLRDHIIRLARRATASVPCRIPPVPLAALAGRCGASEDLRVEVRIPPQTPRWNGLAAVALARRLVTGVPGAASAADAPDLVETAAAELLLPARVFVPLAARTDLTMDGVRELARRFSAPIRLTVRQWLAAGDWSGFAFLWRGRTGGLRLAWRAASPRLAFPPGAEIGTSAGRLFRDPARLEATFLTGRPHHGLEEVWTGTRPAWWFTRFGAVRDEVSPAVLALVVFERRGRRPAAPSALPHAGAGPPARQARGGAGGRRTQPRNTARAERSVVVHPRR